jgi:hypothetical protein
MSVAKNCNRLFTSTIEERASTTLPDDQTIRNHTRMIALQSKVPFMYTVCGAYVNDKCHIHASYAENHFVTIINS